MDEADDPFEEFKKQSPYYWYKTRKNGTRQLGATDNRDAKSLSNFQIYAKRALEIAAAHGFRVTPHTIRNRSGVRVYDKIVIIPDRV